eukprot:7836960-Pyramimonas_sp.AAC.1
MSACSCVRGHTGGGKEDDRLHAGVTLGKSVLWCARGANPGAQAAAIASHSANFCDRGTPLGPHQ